MGMVDIKTRGGRTPVIARVNGELVVIKRATKIGNTLGIFLPREWVKAVEAKHKQSVGKFMLTYNTEVMTIRPYFGDEG